MKLELPLAALLIAAGCLLWSARASRGVSDSFKGQASQAESFQGQASESAAENSDSNVQSSFPVVPAEYQQADRDLPASSQSTDLIRNAAEALVNSAGIEADARITIRLFGEIVIANGKYYQEGKGTNRSRLDFKYEYGEGADTISITQLCDGRFYYTLTQYQKKRRLEFVDLERVTAANGSPQSIFGDPTDLLATGGIASLLQSLAAGFDFEAPIASELGGISMVSVSGTWKPEKLQQLVAELVEPADLHPKIKWQKLPPQIPHSVEVTLGNDDFFPLFPYKIEFYQHDQESNGINLPMLTLELFEVNKSSTLPSQRFKINTDKANQIDATERYVAQVKELQQNRGIQQARNSRESKKR